MSSVTFSSLFAFFILFASSCHALYYCEHHLIVYQNGGDLNTESRDKINFMITELHLAGKSLCWDGTSSSNPATVTTLINSGLYDVLLALNPSNYNPIWSPSVGNTVNSLLQSGHLHKLVVFDRYSRNDINVIGVNGLVSLDYESWIYPVDPSGQPSNGPAGIVGAWQGNFAAHGYFNCLDYNALKASHPEARSHYVNGANKSTIVDYCVNGNNVIYSTTPMDFYLSGAGGSFRVKALDYFTNVMNMLMCLNCETTTCKLNYRLLFAHSTTYQAYRATLVTPYQGETHDITCHLMGDSHHFVGVGPEKESKVVRVYENSDCTGSFKDIECNPWLTYGEMPSSDFGTCSNNGTHLTLTGLPDEATHVMSGGDPTWSGVPVVGNSVEVLCPGGSWEVNVCAGPDCDWVTELMYNMVDAGAGSCYC